MASSKQARKRDRRKMVNGRTLRDWERALDIEAGTRRMKARRRTVDDRIERMLWEEE